MTRAVGPSVQGLGRGVRGEGGKIYSKVKMISWFVKLSVQTFQPLIVIYRRGNFVYNRDVHQFIGHCLIP